MSDKLRLFECPDCGHRLRFGARRCGDCYGTTPIWNRLSAWRMLVVSLIIVGGGFGFVMLA